MSTNDDRDVHNSDKDPYFDRNTYSGGMTPSIVTTINNTNPTPPVNSAYNNNQVTATSKNRRIAEPYESYIEDSFVGHWEREDDDLDDRYNTGNGCNSQDGGEHVDEPLHPSTIEFDFDSFGPESFIYTPVTRNPLQQDVDNSNSEVRNQISENSAKVNPAEPCREDSTEAPKPARPPPKLRSISPSPIDYLVDPAKIDLRVIEPYKKVISHAGYCHQIDPTAPAPNHGEPAPAVIVFSACYLPDRSRRDYNYVMDHLFLYVLSSLHELIADDYILIYLHNTQPSSTAASVSSKTSSMNNSSNGSTSSAINEESQTQNNLPTFSWMKRCYQMIDRKLRKNLRILYLVKPTFWLKTVVVMCKPFISSKFSKKLRFIENMDGLRKCLPVDELILPASAENI